MATLGIPQNTIAVLQKYHFNFQKKYGQNFLIDTHVLEKIMDAAGITKEDFVLEIGPGIGTMTQYLCERAREVVAVEIDSGLIPILDDTLSEYDNVSVMNEDILKLDINRLAEEKNAGRPIRVVANLPYYITTPIVMRLFESHVPIENITIMVQKEVADRMQAGPGTKDYGALSLAVQYYAEPKLIANVPPNCFIPRPTVASTVIRLTRHKEAPVQVNDEELLFRLIRASFNQRRKTLANGLSHSPDIALPKEELSDSIAELGVPVTVRGEALTLEQFAKLSNIIGKRLHPDSYQNVPLVADWITGEKSGQGMGADIMEPIGVPPGIDPELVDTSAPHVVYTYDESYQAPAGRQVLWYKTGAYLAGANHSIYARDGADWEQLALPIGNGYLGGMLFGMPDKDQIQMNEETFWAAGYRGTQQVVSPDTVNERMSEHINGYMSVGNVFADFHMPENTVIHNYCRDLNLEDGTAHVRYEQGGISYRREYFASYPKEVLVFRYTAAKKGALTFTVSFVSMHPGTVTVKDGEIRIVGRLKDAEPYVPGGKVVWSGTSDLEYCTVVRVIADDGVVTTQGSSVHIAGATGVTVLAAAATDYDKDRFVLNPDGSVALGETPYKNKRGVRAAMEKADARINGAAAMTYETLKAEHIADYRSQSDKVRFSLTDEEERCGLPTDELQASYRSVVKATLSEDGTTVVSCDRAAYASLDRHLEELYYSYARYLMISSARRTTMPATLQGKWCQSTAEIWGSCYCININMEMNYWFAGGANLADSAKSLIRWFNSQIPAGRITARNMYGVTPKSYTWENGRMTFADSSEDADDVFFMHTKQAIMGTTDLTGSTKIQSAGNTAWLMYNLWDLYQTTGDRQLLAEKIYPIMRKAANFYTQYLYCKGKRETADTEKYPDGYYYTTWAGCSPEHGPTQEGIKYDLQLVAGMYDDTIAAAEVLGTDHQKAAAWREIRSHLEAPVEYGEDGQIKEWAQETSYNTDEDGNAIGDPVHRHISHLVGLYPGTLIHRATPEWLAGAKIVLTKRGDASTGWSCANKFLLWARALEGDKALELFRYQLAQKTYANLFDTHPPFQIDGNFGSAAGIMELLMQSQTGIIYILPALPYVWEKGSICGIRAKNGAEISIRWSEHKACEFTVTPCTDGDLIIGYGKENTAFRMNGQRADFDGGLYTIRAARAGERYTFTPDGR